MKKFRWNTISVRLFIWFLFSTLFLVLLLTSIFYTYSTNQMSLRIAEIARKNVSQAADTFNLLAQGYNSLTKSITASSDVQRVLTEDETTPALQLINSRTIINVLEAAFYSRNDLVGIHIITNSGKVYSYEAATHPYESNFVESAWYDEIRHSQGEMLWFGMKKPTLTIQEQPVFSFGRLIYDLYSREPIGVLLIEASPRPILSTLSNLHMGAGSLAFIMTLRDPRYQEVPNRNEILAETGETDHGLSPEMDRLLVDRQAARFTPQTETDHLIVMEDQPNLKWSIGSVTPKSNFQVQLQEANRYFLIVLCLLLLAAVILATIMSRSISAPIIRLVREMKALERGNLNTIVEIRSFEEMNYLVSNFNQMVSRIRQLVDRVRIVTASEKNAQLYALQSQVNPHFLYNTLDMIYWELDDTKNDKLGDVIFALSKMFRYSSEWHHSDVTLQEELDQTHHYLHIIQARSGGRLQIHLDIPDEWLHVQIPKMTLQPLIENAVVHGLSKLDRSGFICVHMEISEQDLFIRIQDNGSGIPNPKLIDLQKTLEKVMLLEMHHFEEEEKNYRIMEQTNPVGAASAGIGLVNVHRRLVLKFGASYGLQIASEQGSGTTITIALPKCKSVSMVNDPIRSGGAL
ncbi:two-component system, sensor histidine kinase YesM [Paenibacillus sp. 1_12]|uniref:cache domain-containing sensor histidine kinase n=1 Tax=Paenibacillus sp. 1_12 TaxID=1566278 RepID=UPI0008DFE572|nr:sensor histidine kinase [Paenibacillus sp. 1_12]SFL64515.1 two-component system, sensor histidine kinase YesM [Paenibacillus sp. 1_12]